MCVYYNNSIFDSEPEGYFAAPGGHYKHECFVSMEQGRDGVSSGTSLSSKCPYVEFLGIPSSCAILHAYSSILRRTQMLTSRHAAT